DAKYDSLAFAGVSARSLRVSDAASEPGDDRIPDFLGLVADDPDGFRFVQPFDDQIDDFEGDKIGDHGHHRIIPAEHKSGAAQDEHVEEHDDLADGKGQLAVAHDGHDFGAVHRPAETDDHADADAQQNAAENGGQKRLVRHGRHIVKEEGASRQPRDSKQGAQGKCFVAGFVAQNQEGKIQKEQIITQRNPCQVFQHDGYAGDAAVDDPVRHEKNV